MSSLVNELQREALDRSVNVSDILRKALVVSSKLNIIDIQEWLSYELNGYPLEDDLIPEYRLVRGSPKVHNPFHGWQPLNFSSPKEAEFVSKRKNSQAIGQLDDLLSKDDSGTYMMEYPAEITNALMKGMDIALQPALIVSRSSLIGILDSVRNKVLMWALELEAKGIVGEGMSFTEKEKKAAHSVTYQVTNHIGNMTNSQLQQDSAHATQVISVNNDLSQVSKFIDQLVNQLDNLQLNHPDKMELQAEVTTIQSQLKSPKPKPTIVSESLKSIRSILEGATSSILASGLLHQIASLLD